MGVQGRVLKLYPDNVADQKLKMTLHCALLSTPPRVPELAKKMQSQVSYWMPIFIWIKWSIDLRYPGILLNFSFIELRSSGILFLYIELQFTGNLTFFSFYYASVWFVKQLIMNIKKKLLLFKAEGSETKSQTNNKQVNKQAHK